MTAHLIDGKKFAAGLVNKLAAVTDMKATHR